MPFLRRVFLVSLLLGLYPLGVYAITPQVRVYRQINIARRAHARPALVLSTRLSKVAQQRAQLMANSGVVAHAIPGQPSTWEMVKATRYTYTRGGEVIGVNYSDPKKLIRAWELSTGHRTILYSPKYNQVGVGQVYVKNNKKVMIITVAIFAFHPKNTP